MKCPKCHFENPSEMKFCGKCGAKFENIYPQCKSSNPSEFSFCVKCGHDLREPEETHSKDFSEPQTYSPKFLENFTSNSEKLDPEEIHRIMVGCFKTLMGEIHRFGGFETLKSLEFNVYMDRKHTRKDL